MTVWIIAFLLALAAAIVLYNRMHHPDLTSAKVSGTDHDLPAAGAQISVVTWNIGYAGLGKDADFVVDHGSSIRALSKPQIAAAAQRIGGRLGQGSWDVICLQEQAEPSFLTRHVNVRATIERALGQVQSVFWHDLKTLFFPPILRFRHAMATYARVRFNWGGILPFPDGESHFLGFLKKSYVGLITRFPVTPATGDTGREWVVINLHLPVFGTSDAIRAAQVRHLFDIAGKEHAKGNYVVIAGDWNMRLHPTSFKHQSDARNLEWLSDFPHHLVPHGWQCVVDPKVATVRVMNEPYRVGQTYTTIIDGFIVSPNVRVDGVRTIDLGFADTDHHPVEAQFSANDITP